MVNKKGVAHLALIVIVLLVVVGGVWYYNSGSDDSGDGELGELGLFPGDDSDLAGGSGDGFGLSGEDGSASLPEMSIGGITHDAGNDQITVQVLFKNYKPSSKVLFVGGPTGIVRYSDGTDTATGTRPKNVPNDGKEYHQDVNIDADGSGFATMTLDLNFPLVNLEDYRTDGLSYTSYYYLDDGSVDTLAAASLIGPRHRFQGS